MWFPIPDPELHIAYPRWLVRITLVFTHPSWLLYVPIIESSDRRMSIIVPKSYIVFLKYSVNNHKKTLVYLTLLCIWHAAVYISRLALSTFGYWYVRSRKTGHGCLLHTTIFGYFVPWVECGYASMFTIGLQLVENLSLCPSARFSSVHLRSIISTNKRAKHLNEYFRTWCLEPLTLTYNKILFCENLKMRKNSAIIHVIFINASWQFQFVHCVLKWKWSQCMHRFDHAKFHPNRP